MSHWTDHLDPRQPDGAFLSWKEVARRVGISRTTAWRLRKAGDFPSPFMVSAGRVAYREREVEAWRASRPRRGAEPAEAPVSKPGGAAWRCPAIRGRSGRRRRAGPPPDQITFDF